MPPTLTTKKLYRRGVGIVLLNNKNEVFVGERIDTPGAWQMPQGGIDAGEDIKIAALRELKEETGTEKAEIIRVADRNLFYDFPKNIGKKLWEGKYQGQEQTWVAMRFTGQDKDIDLNSFDPPEFQAWQWISVEEMLELIVPFKRDVYKQVAKMFDNILTA